MNRHATVIIATIWGICNDDMPRVPNTFIKHKCELIRSCSSTCNPHSLKMFPMPGRPCVAVIFLVYLTTISIRETSTNQDVADFIRNYLKPPLTIVSARYANTTSILQTDLPKVVIYHDMNVSQIALDKKSNYIFVVEDFSELELVLKYLSSTNNWNCRRNHLVAYQKPTSKEVIRKSFGYLFRNNIYNAVVHHRENIFYTWYPYDEASHCGAKVNLVKVLGFDPYEGKVPVVLKGCVINVTWPKMDLFLWDPFSKTPGALFLFFNTMAQAMNVSVVYLKNNTDFFQSFVLTGNNDVLENDMTARNIDLVLYAGVNGDFTFRNLDYSPRICQEHFYFVLPPRKPIGRRNFFFNMYGTSLLCSMAAAMTVSCFIWKLLRRQSMIDSIFDIFQLTVQLLINKSPSTTKCKVFLGAVLLFLMCLNAAYQTTLSSLLTRPNYTPQIKSIRQLILHTDLKVAAFNNTLRLLYSSKEMRDELKKKWYVFPSHLRSVDLIKQFVRNQTQAIVVSRYYLNYFRNPRSLHIVGYDPVGLLVALVAAKKGYPLMDALNYWIDNLKETGLMEKFMTDTSRTLKKFNVTNFMRRHSYVKLDLTHLEGAFIIWSMGIAVSGIAFVLELFANLSKRNIPFQT